MQRGSLMRVTRKQGPDVWQFRWLEEDLNGRRVYRKRMLGGAPFAKRLKAPSTRTTTSSVTNHFRAGLAGIP
jgi:hypothetical protein